MRPDQILYAALTSGSPTTDVSEAVGGRIYPVRVPSSAPLPAVAYKRMSSSFENVLDMQAPAGTFATFDVWCVAGSYTAAEDLGDLLEVLDEDGIRLVDRRSEQGEAEGAPFAAILTFEVIEY
jgi:hypothetical protein